MIIPERKILGVCAWLSHKFGLDVGGVRILFIASFVIGIGSPFIIYLILYLIKPNQY